MICRLNRIAFLDNGTKIKGKKLPYLEAKYLRGKSSPTYLTEGVETFENEYIILVDGENSGEVFLNKENGYLGSTFKKLNITSYINAEYFIYILKYFQNYLRNSKKGAAIPHLNKELFKNLIITIPPVNEQKRIVQKIETLVPYIESYGNKYTKLEILNNSYKDELKKSVLQYAIQGKLVPQNANDESANVLINKILEEKRELIKTKQIKKENLSVIYKDDTDNQFYEKFDDGTIINITDEIPFDIPNTWVWARLGVISNYANNKSVQGNFIGDNEWVLELEDIEKNTGTVLNEILQKDRKAVSNKHIFYKGNILYGKLRPYLKKVVIANKDGYCTTEIIPIDFGKLCNEYMKYLLLSNYFTDITTSLSYGAKMPRLGTKDAIKILLPIPPINEQKNIVNKIESTFGVLNS